MENELSCHDNNLRLGVQVWLPYEIYWKILPELLEYHLDLFMDSWRKWVDKNFPNKNNDTPEEGKDE